MIKFLAANTRKEIIRYDTIEHDTEELIRDEPYHKTESTFCIHLILSIHISSRVSYGLPVRNASPESAIWRTSRLSDLRPANPDSIFKPSSVTKVNLRLRSSKFFKPKTKRITQICSQNTQNKNSETDFSPHRNADDTLL